MAAAMVDMWDMGEPLEEGEEEWQTSCRVLQQRGEHLLKSGDWTDCTFLVGQEKEPIKAHKLILSAASPVFESLFYNEQGVISEEPVEVPAIKMEAFQALLNYIYTENISIDSYNMAYRVYKAAQHFMIPQLAQVCSMYMSCNLTVDNALHGLHIGFAFGELMIIDECLQVIRDHTREIIAQEAFKHISFCSLVAILKQDRLKIASELELWKVVKDFAKRYPRSKTCKTDTHAHVKTDTNDGDGGKEHNTTRKKPTKSCQINIRTAIAQLRFLTLTAEEFAAGPAGSGLLTQEESFAVLMNIANVSVPMPEGFSTSREPRWPNSSLQASPLPRPTPPPPPSRSSLSFRLTLRECQPDHLSILDRPPQCVTSPAQSLMGATWRVIMVPRFTCSSSTRLMDVYFGVFVRCEDPKVAPWSRIIHARCTVQPRQPAQAPHTLEGNFEVTSAKPEHGFTRFLSVSSFHDYHYVPVNDTKRCVDVEVTVRPAPGHEGDLHDEHEANDHGASSAEE